MCQWCMIGYYVITKQIIKHMFIIVLIINFFNNHHTKYSIVVIA